MKIKHMRIVLPARMASSVHFDARMIAEAAARALHGSTAVNGPITVQVHGHGQPARFISQSVFRETSRQSRSYKQEG